MLSLVWRKCIWLTRVVVCLQELTRLDNQLLGVVNPVRCALVVFFLLEALREHDLAHLDLHGLGLLNLHILHHDVATRLQSWGLIFVIKLNLWVAWARGWHHSRTFKLYSARVEGGLSARSELDLAAAYLRQFSCGLRVALIRQLDLVLAQSKFLELMCFDSGLVISEWFLVKLPFKVVYLLLNIFTQPSSSLRHQRIPWTILISFCWHP